jgi:predicted ATP-binding protein involved in virulence
MGEQKFGFNEMSDGFKAAINIVSDLILKMQHGGKLSDAYQKEGIVLIDEIETHLHLELQRIIMPFLTKTFPNIQFIVTTHSPFVLNSMPDAVAFDLEHRKVLDDLTEYSYESLAEGYFGVRTPSSYAEMQLETLKSLLDKETWTDADKVEIRQLKSEFEKISETASPMIVGGFRQMMIQNADKLKNL